MSSLTTLRLDAMGFSATMVGVVSLGDLSMRVKERYAGETLEDISQSS